MQGFSVGDGFVTSFPKNVSALILFAVLGFINMFFFSLSFNQVKYNVFYDSI